MCLTYHLKDKADGLPALGGGTHSLGEGAGGEDDGCDKHFAGGRLGASRGTSDSDWREFRDPRGSLALTGKPCGRRGRK